MRFFVIKTGVVWPLDFELSHTIHSFNHSLTYSLFFLLFRCVLIPVGISDILFLFVRKIPRRPWSIYAPTRNIMVRLSSTFPDAILENTFLVDDFIVDTLLSGLFENMLWVCCLTWSLFQGSQKEGWFIEGIATMSSSQLFTFGV